MSDTSGYPILALIWAHLSLNAGALTKTIDRVVVKMKKIIGVVVLLGVAWALFHFHFILLDDQLKFLPKAKLTLDNTFVDARGGRKIRLIMNPDLVRAGFREAVKDIPD